MVLSLHKQPFVTAHFQFITAHFVRHCALKNALVFPLDQPRRVGVTESEHPMLTNGEIIFEEVQPM